MQREAQLIGQRFGALTVMERVGKTKERGVLWRLVCDCGGERVRSTRELRKLHGGACPACVAKVAVERLRRCGRPPPKGRHRNPDPLYKTWTSMRERCNNTAHPAFRWYGGKGVSVCAEWNDYDVFRVWALANGYARDPEMPKADRLSIDRIDPSGNYEPANCRWIPLRVNCKRLRPEQEVSHLLL